MSNDKALLEKIEFPNIKHIIGMEDLNREQIEIIVNGSAEIANRIREGFPWWEQPLQRQKKATIVSSEGSTRTVGSFDRAAEILGWNRRVIPLDTTSMAKKNETWLHSARTWRIQGASVLAMRTTTEGAQKWIAEEFDRQEFDTSVINMGDGWARHPTQALLDLVTIKLKLGRIDNFKIGFLGDALRGRTVHSLLDALSLRDGVSVVCVSPENMRPPKHYQRMFKSFKVTDDLEILSDCDVVYVLRTQRERPMDNSNPPQDTSYQKFRITVKVLRTLKPSVIIMHAQPVDGVTLEISYEAQNDPRIAMWSQNENGIFLRTYALEMCQLNRQLADYHLPKNGIKINETFSEPLEKSLARQKEKLNDRFVPINDIGVVIDGVAPGLGMPMRDMLIANGDVTSDIIDVFEGVHSESKPGNKKDVVIIRGLLLNDEAFGLVAGLNPKAKINPVSDGSHRKISVCLKQRKISGIGRCQNSGNCVTAIRDTETGGIKEPGIKPKFKLTEDNGDIMAMCEYCQREYPLTSILKINS